MDDLQDPLFRKDKVIPPGGKLTAVFEELQIASHVNADLDELRMGIDADAIRFGLLYFDAFFQDDGLRGS